MTEQEKWDYIIALDDELLLGGVILSEWCSFIVREAEEAFAKGANLAAILTAVSGIETYLRSESSISNNDRLVQLIEKAGIVDDLKEDLHELRRYRNRWVHVDAPMEDQEILQNPEKYEMELEKMAMFAIRVLLRTIYSEPFV